MPQLKKSIAVVFLGLLLIGSIGIAIHGSAAAKSRSTSLREIEALQSSLQARIVEAQWSDSDLTANPSAKLLVEKLGRLLTHRQLNRKDMPEQEDWILRNAAATLANANCEPEKALGLVTESDELHAIGNYRQVLETRATSFFALREWAEALSRYEKLAKNHDETLWPRNAAGLCHLELRQYDEAFTIFDESVKRYTTLYEQAGDNDLAIELARYHGKRSRSLLVLHEALNDAGVAVRIFTRLVQEGENELEYELAESHRHLGCLHFLAGKFEAAQQELSKAIETLEQLAHQQGRVDVNHKLASSYYSRSNALIRQGMLDEAYADCHKAVSMFRILVDEGRSDLKEDLALSHMIRGQTLTRQGRQDEAIGDSDKALELLAQLIQQDAGSEFVDELGVSRRLRGDALLAKGNEDAAIEEYGKAIDELTRSFEFGQTQVEEDIATAYRARGAAFYTLGKYDAATRDFGKAIDIHSRMMLQEATGEKANAIAASHLRRGAALNAQGNLDAAIEDYGQSIELYRRFHGGELEMELNLIKAYGNLGTALGAQGNHAAAHQEFAKAMQVLAKYVSAGALENELARMYVRRAEVLDGQKEYAAAIQDINKAIEIQTRLISVGQGELAPELAQSYHNRGAVLSLGLGNHTAAAQDFERAVEIQARLIQEQGERGLAGDLERYRNNLNAVLHLKK